MPKLLFGLNVDPRADRTAMAFQLASLADEHGLDIVSVMDHPEQPRFLETWTLLVALAMRTERVAVMLPRWCGPTAARSWVRGKRSTPWRRPCRSSEASGTPGIARSASRAATTGCRGPDPARTPQARSRCGSGPSDRGSCA